MHRGVNLAMVLGLAGCARASLESVPDVPVQAAWLEGFDLHTIAAIGGVTEGDAILGYTDLGGETLGLNVHLGGGIAGAVFDITFDPELGASVPLDLTDAETDPVMLSDLLGTYRGSAFSISLPVGIDSRELKNRHGIRLDEEHFAIGFGIMAGFEWVRIKEGGSEGLEDTGPGETGETGETGDSAVDTGDTGEPGPGSGRPPPQNPPPQENGRGCASDDDTDDDEGDGCCCTTSSSLMGVGLWILIGGRRKKMRGSSGQGSSATEKSPQVSSRMIPSKVDPSFETAPLRSTVR